VCPDFHGVSSQVLDLLEAGRGIAEVAYDLGISEQSIYTWRRQDRIDRGLVPGLSSLEKAELVGAKKRIAGLETELAIARRPTELLRVSSDPKNGFGGRGGRREAPGPGRLPGRRSIGVGLLRVARRDGHEGASIVGGKPTLTRRCFRRPGLASSQPN
jgi:transposase